MASPVGYLRPQPARWAVIDLGTNSVRFDIYRWDGRKAHRVYRNKTMVRLGDGVFKTGRLSKEGQARTLRAFIGYSRLIRRLGVERVVAFGTSALRSSTNSKSLLTQIQSQTGIHVRVISGREEGRLIARGIMANIKVPTGRYALIDIGGGSTEISICSGMRVVKCQSLPLGANRLQQLYFKTIPPRLSKGRALHPVLALRQDLKLQLLPLARSVAGKKLNAAIGSSGTIRSVGRILKKAGFRQPAIPRTGLSAMVAEMQVMTRSEIRRIPGLEPKRVDLILAGSILLEEILYALNVRHLHVTEFALRDGILQTAIETAQPPKRRKKRR